MNPDNKELRWGMKIGTTEWKSPWGLDMDRMSLGREEREQKAFW